MKRFIVNLLLLFILFPVHSTNYYLSANGNDNASGTSPAQAWKTIDRLQQQLVNISPGDSILFRRGDTFFGQIDLLETTNLGNPVVFSAYGNGARPIISGSRPITAWTKLNGSQIWSASVNLDTVAYLFANQKQQTLARYPNSGYVTITSGGKLNELSSTALPGGNNYWQGTTARIRTTRWTYEMREVSSSTSAGKLNFASNLRYKADKDWGFFLDNKYQELDMPGEWFYNHQSKKVYFWPLNNQNPNQMNITGSSKNYGIYQIITEDLDHFVFENLVFADQILEGIRINSNKTKRITIQDCEFYRQGETGILISGRDIHIRDCYFADQLGRGIKANKIFTSEVRNNVFRRIGMQEGYGFSGNQNMNALHLTNGDSLYVGYNDIDSVGYTGITAYLAHSTIERNFIHDFNLRLDDGSAIYSWGDQSNYNLIQENFVRNGPGYTVGTNKPDKFTSNGIYMDLKAHHNTIRNNTIQEISNAGIFINSGNYDNLIEDNVIMDFGGQAFRLMEIQQVGTHVDNLYQGNVAYSFGPQLYPVTIFSLSGTEYDLGSFQGNYLINPYEDYSANIGTYTNQRGFTLEEWANVAPTQASGNFDSPFRFTGYEILQENGPNLINNGNFDADMNGWGYTQTNDVSSGWVSNVGLDGGAAKMHMLNGNNNTATISTNPSQDLKKDHFYHIEFSVISQGFGILEIVIQDQNKKLIEKVVRPYTPTRREHKLILPVSQDIPNAKLLFRQKYPKGNFFIIDNVSMTDVDVQPEDPKDKVELLKNHTANPKSFQLTGTYYDVDGSPVSGSVTVPPYRSRLLVKEPGSVASSGGNQAPFAVISANTLTGPAPLSVNFDGAASSDPDGSIVSYKWTFGQGSTGNGIAESTTYNNPGNYQVRLIVTDDQGLKDTAFTTVLVTPAGGSGGGSGGSGGSGTCTLSADWSSADIGKTTIAGEACEDIQNGQFAITSYGQKIEGKFDRTHFMYQDLTGDGVLTARITASSGPNNAMSGLMMRNGLGGGAEHVFMGVSQSGRWISQSRSAKATPTQRTDSPTGTVTFPFFVRIERKGNEYKTYYAQNGANWQLVDTYTIPMENTVQIGLASASYSSSQSMLADWDQLGTGNVMNPGDGGTDCALSSAWSHQNIGNVTTPGEVCEDSVNLSFQIRAAGERVGKKFDRFHYVYRSLQGDGSISGRINRLSSGQNDATVGLMIREQLGSNSRYAFIGVNLDDQYQFKTRKANGSFPVVQSGPKGSMPLPYFFKLERTGNQLEAFISANGQNWQSVGSETLSLPSDCFIGMAVASGDAVDTVGTMIDQLVLGGSITQSNALVDLSGQDEPEAKPTNRLRTVPQLQITIFPNPLRGNNLTLILEGQISDEPYQVFLLDQFGRRLSRWAGNQPSLELRMPDSLTAGHYFLLVNHREGVLRKSLIIKH
ncbi:MAG: PKD domain-containing protein [Bacteroidota bacterium]